MADLAETARALGGSGITVRNIADPAKAAAGKR
jgi:hypothetical protein